MTDPNKPPHAPGYVPNPHYSEEDWDEAAENPEWTDEELAQARSFAEVFPELAKTIAKRGPQKAPTKVATSIRLDRDVVAALKATGSGWQTKANDLLRKALRARAKRSKSARRAPAKKAARKKSA
jgi:uncharacterized protein (DUF4415 family)